MNHITPKSLKIIKILAIIVFVLSLPALLSITLLVQTPLVFVAYLVSLAFYIALIVAIHTGKRKYYVSTKYLLMTLLVISVISLFLPGKIFTLLKIVIEVVFLKYLSRHREYFSK